MFSHVLANYQSTLLHFWAKTSRTMTAVADSFKGYQYYEFNMLKVWESCFGEVLWCILSLYESQLLTSIQFTGGWACFTACFVIYVQNIMTCFISKMFLVKAWPLPLCSNVITTPQEYNCDAIVAHRCEPD